ncbi:conjugal transfer protein TrbH [Neorhizobium sp. BT27B]|uniref:conjugal transfer protein TrbH n=1 Tax=Neorhizobium sp. BT27B TaxID=3142625 RepID=UPI003D284DE6
MRLWFSMCLIVVTVSSCQISSEAIGPKAEPIAVSSAAVGAIAGDMAARLAEHLPPAATRLNMKSDGSEFAAALEAALKGWGYTMIAEQSSGSASAMKLEYGLEGTDGQLLVQLSTTTIALGRAYDASHAGAVPASPLSIMTRG